MRVIVVAVVLIAAVGAALPARAAPARSCNLVSDGRGDATVPTKPSPLGGGAAAVDILSADIANDGRVMTAVIRVVDVEDVSVVDASGATRSEFGYDLAFTTESSTWRFLARIVPGQRPQAFKSQVWTGAREADPGAPGGIGRTWVGRDFITAAAVVDPKRDEIRITATMKDLARLGRLPYTIGPVTASTATGTQIAGGGGVTRTVDEGRGTAFYRLGSPSCVRPSA